FLIGYATHRAIVGSPPPRSNVVKTIGVALTLVSVVLAVSAAWLFARRRTTLVPHRTSSELVIEGPFRFTRNPMYVTLIAIYVAVTLWTGASAALALLLLPLVVTRCVHSHGRSRIARAVW